MSITKTIEEQALFGFTGRINVLLGSNNQFKGAVLLIDGLIIDAQFEGVSNEKALYAMVYKDLINNNLFSFVVEPEIIENSSAKFRLNIENFKKKASVAVKRFREAEKFRPPENVKLMVNGSFIASGAQVSSAEYNVISVISEYSRVLDIYKYSKLREFEVTEALISLRKKDALKVINN